MAGYEIRPLNVETWPAFAALVERHNGVWGGCWCMGFHEEARQKGADHRAQKEARVREGRAHAALVFDGERCVGWCQFGSPEELPLIKFGRAYRDVAGPEPNWRITCFFVDSACRRRGVAAAALRGALREIARLGGGTVESMPEDVTGRKVSNSFLYNATISIFEEQGFVRTRQLGKNSWLVTKKVRARRDRSTTAAVLPEGGTGSRDA
jgi:ribosomal protein S18 acetylase RimI-like enzyme